MVVMLRAQETYRHSIMKITTGTFLVVNFSIQGQKAYWSVRPFVLTSIPVITASYNAFNGRCLIFGRIFPDPKISVLVPSYSEESGWRLFRGMPPFLEESC